MWITVRRRAARQHDFEQPNRFIYFAEFKKIGVFCVEIIENPQLAENRDYARHCVDASIYPQHVDNLCKLLKFVSRVGKNA